MIWNDDFAVQEIKTGPTGLQNIVPLHFLYCRHDEIPISIAKKQSIMLETPTCDSLFGPESCLAISKRIKNFCANDKLWP